MEINHFKWSFQNFCQPPSLSFHAKQRTEVEGARQWASRLEFRVNPPVITLKRRVSRGSGPWLVTPEPPPFPRTAGYKWSVVKVVRVARERQREREGTFDSMRDEGPEQSVHFVTVGKKASGRDATSYLCIPVRRRDEEGPALSSANDPKLTHKGPVSSFAENFEWQPLLLPFGKNWRTSFHYHYYYYYHYCYLFLLIVKEIFMYECSKVTGQCKCNAEWVWFISTAILYYSMEAAILENKPHAPPEPQLRYYWYFMNFG